MAVDDCGGELGQMPYRSCRRCYASCIIFDLWHALLEDIAEAFKVVEIGGAKLLRHAALISSESFLAAASTRSAGVTVGVVRYLCL